MKNIDLIDKLRNVYQELNGLADMQFLATSDNGKYIFSEDYHYLLGNISLSNALKIKEILKYLEQKE